MRKIWLVGLLVIPLFTLELLAVSPQFWTTSSFRDFSKGRLKGLSLREDGTLFLGRRFDTVLDSDQALIWSAVYDTNQNLYVGTGHDGKVFKIDNSGKASLFFKSTELEVLALALDREQDLYAATSPNGKIYKVTAAGEVSVFFDPSDKFIWDLVFGPDGVLYVATGSKGKVYKVSREGRGEELYDTGQTNVICLAMDRQSQLVAGSDQKGYVYQITPDGKAFVLYDTGMDEVHDIQVNAKGEIFFIAIDGGQEKRALDLNLAAVVSPQETVSVGLSLSPPSSRVATTAGEPLKQSAVSIVPAKRGNLKSRLHRIRRDHSVETLWSSKREIAYGLYLDGKGNVIFSTGDKGKIYSLSQKEELTLLLETTEEQITLLVPAGDNVVVCTSNLAKIFRLTPQLNRQGSFESKVKDSQAISSWGSINWRSETPEGTSLKVYTRSGNTQRPDRTWSNWSKAYTSPEGEDMQSPEARYIQYKVVLNTTNETSPYLSRVVVPYLQRNLAPNVQSINIFPPGVAFLRTAIFSGNQFQASSADRKAAKISGAAKVIPKPAGVPTLPRRTFEKGAQSFTWKAQDPNFDELSYSIYYRGESEPNWKLLVENHLHLEYTLQSGMLPDGDYLIKIQASDMPSNPASKAKSGELVSAPFSLDNTPPVIKVLFREVLEKKAALRFSVSDTVSSLRKAEFSTDGNAWKAIFSRDGIIDSKTEEFDITTKALGKGQHVVALRVYDATGNVSIGKAILHVE